MVTVVVISAASTVYGRWRFLALDQAVSMATNGAPSVRLIAVARSELLQLRRIAEAALAGDGPGIGNALTSAGARVGEALTAEIRTPDYPGEHEIGERAMAALAKLQLALRQTGGADRLSTAQHAQIEHASDELDARLDELHLANAVFMQRDADWLVSQQREAMSRVFWIDVATLIGSALVAFLLVRLVRQYLTVAARRTRELEYFAVQVGHDVFNPLLPIRVTLELVQELAPSTISKDAIARSLRGVDRIRRSTEALLAFARAGTPPAPDHRASVRVCVRSLADGAADPRVSVAPVEDVTVHASEMTLDALLSAYLHEALRLARPSEPIRVMVGTKGDRVRIAFHHPLHGQEPRSAELFAPRIRERASGAPGIELELVAARSIVEAHGGAVGAGASGEDHVLWFELPVA